MKAIILAGGLGTRLNKYAKDLPKGMLLFLGKSIIEKQVETFRKCGINNIVIVRKHLADKINVSGTRYCDEDPATEGNMVRGLFHARGEFDDDVIMTYGDVVFEEKVIRKVIESNAEVGVVVDTHWQDYWTSRLGSVTQDSESMVLDEDRIVSLGIPNPDVKNMYARYVGIIKFSKDVLPKIERLFDKEKEKYWDKDDKWYQSKNFKKAYMTDWLQHLINNNFDVRAIKIERGWLEFDTNEDYEQALEWNKTGTLEKFYSPDR